MSNHSPPIDLDDLTKAQSRQVARILNTGADIGEAQRKIRAARLRAIRDTFEKMLEANAEAPFLEDLFVALELAATKGAAAKIATHPRRPDSADKALQRRREEAAEKATEAIDV